jgi:S-(hydroxymethyl)glutathione dehydrogenase/alcohol dehydrogenase
MEIKAAILEKLCKPLVVRKLNTRELQRGQVLVKILYSGVCRSQLMEINGKRGEDKWLPHLLGHEGSGVVLKVGEDVSKFKEGDEVIITWLKSSGIDAPGAVYDGDGFIVNSGKATTFSNYSVISENRLIHKPSTLGFDVAVLFGCALPTGAGMVINQMNLTADSKVAVIGLGGVGFSAVAALMAIGVKEIIVIDNSEDKLLHAKKMGIKKAIRYDHFNKRECNFDFCFESAGSIESIEFGYSLIKKSGGKLVFASHPPQGEKIRIDPHELISGKEIIGTWGGNGSNPDLDTVKFHEVFKKSNFNLKSILSRPYKLDNINKAFEDLESGVVIRPLIVMEHEA